MKGVSSITALVTFRGRTVTLGNDYVFTAARTYIASGSNLFCKKKKKNTAILATRCGIRGIKCFFLFVFLRKKCSCERYHVVVYPSLIFLEERIIHSLLDCLLTNVCITPDLQLHFLLMSPSSLTSQSDSSSTHFYDK